MHHRFKTPVSMAFAALALLASPADGQTASAIAPAAAVFPEVDLACQNFALPNEEILAAVAIEGARQNWLAAARQGGLVESTSLFVDLDIVAAGGGTKPGSTRQARLCGIVMAGSKIKGLQPRKLPAREGLAGFCVNTDVKACLAKAAEDSGYTDASPWPNLPIYSRWPAAKTPPTNVTDLISHLATFQVPIQEAVASGGGDTQEFNTGLVPLQVCPEAGCNVPNVPNIVPPNGSGVAWFIGQRSLP